MKSSPRWPWLQNNHVSIAADSLQVRIRNVSTTPTIGLNYSHCGKLHFKKKSLSYNRNIMCKTVNPPSGPSELLLLNASFLPQLRCITPERRQQRKHKTKESSKKSEEGTPVPSPNPGFLSHSTLTCTKTHTCLHSKRAPATITKWAPVKPLTRREK